MIDGTLLPLPKDIHLPTSMEHIATPAETTYTAPEVLCLSKVPYDGGDFLSYPARRGWDGFRLATGDFGEHDTMGTAAFLQDWLYFGTLVEVLGEGASRAVLTDSGYITTLRLDELIQHRLLFFHGLVDTANQQYEKLIQQAEICLSTVSYYCCLATASESALVRWPLSPESDLAIRLLGQRLTGAVKAGLSNIAGGVGFLMGESILWQLRWPAPVLATRRLVEQKWCPSDIARITEQFSPSTMYYISQLKHPASARDHSRCSGRKCVASQVDDSSYKTKHVTDDCDCGVLGPDVESVVKIIEQGRIPLLTMDMTSSTVKILVDSHQPEKGHVREENYDLGPIRLTKTTRDYVAISHVWADGLGNARYNALPYCQLHRLKRILDELRDQRSSLDLLNMGKLGAIVRKKKNVSLRFWMDTLCIPVDPELKHIRKKAIQNMKDVYNKSNQVLVLDADLQNVSSSNLDLTETFMRISLSGWMRRLWTLQEGVLGGRLHFKFHDSILDIAKLYSAIGEAEVDRKATKGQRIMRSTNGTKGTPKAGSLQFFWHMRTMRSAMFPEDEGKSIGYRTESFDAATKRLFTETRRLAGIMTAFEASRFRTTGRAEDVYICLGSLLGWAGADLSSVAPEKRLRLMLERQDTLPQGIIFVPGPRNQDLGWRWAVTDFDNETIMSARIDDFDAAVRDGEGLNITYPGLVLSQTASQALVHSDVVVADFSGGQKRWWHVTLLEELASYGGVICILFFAHSPQHEPHKLIPMAAAVVTVQVADRSSIYDATKRTRGRFEVLANVQLIGNTEDAEVFMHRLDCKAQKLEEPVGIMKRTWTVQ